MPASRARCINIQRRLEDREGRSVQACSAARLRGPCSPQDHMLRSDSRARGAGAGDVRVSSRGASLQLAVKGPDFQQC